MYHVIAHNYTSIFDCNKKVVEYIKNGVPCSVFRHKNGKYCISFGRFSTREEAKGFVAKTDKKVRVVKD